MRSAPYFRDGIRAPASPPPVTPSEGFCLPGVAVNRANKVCSTRGCPEIVPAGVSRCAACDTRADQLRGTSRQRGYSARHERRFRATVLARDPLCVCVDQDHGHGAPCLAPSSVADHHPLSRRELVAAQLDPNDPDRGRGLCAPCHNRHTSRAQPGGWNVR